MPFATKAAPTENTPVDPARATTELESRLAEARANLAEQSRRLGEAVLATADSATINAARRAVDASHAEIASLEAGLQAAQALAKANAEAANLEAEQAHKRALQAELERLQRAAAAVDAVLPSLAAPLRELQDAQESALQLAGGEWTILGGQIKAAGRDVLPAISWGLKYPVGAAYLVQDAHSPTGWSMKLPGSRMVTTDEQAALAPKFAALKVEQE